MPERQPTADQLRAFRDHTRAGPIQMINLLKFRDRAEYSAPIDENADVSGQEAYGRYGAAVSQIVAGLGGRIVWSGTPETVFIGNDGDEWDAVAIVEYPSRAVFLSMIAMPEYQAAHVHREAGLSHQKLIQCRHGGDALS
jgi:uncharacterized protein (DUF1330 family)